MPCQKFKFWRHSINSNRARYRYLYYFTLFRTFVIFNSNRHILSRRPLPGASICAILEVYFWNYYFSRKMLPPKIHRNDERKKNGGWGESPPSFLRCLPLLLSQPRRTDQTGTTRLPNDRSERPVLTNDTRPLSIEVKPSHDHKMIKLPAFDNLFPPQGHSR